MARKSFTINKSTLRARAIFLLIKGGRAAVNAQDDSRVFWPLNPES
jgi:hypothetical protein